MYNVELNKWTTKEPMGEYRKMPGVCCYLNQTIYAFFGCQENFSFQIEKYTQQSSWEPLIIGYSYPTHSVAALPYGEDILNFGGTRSGKKGRDERVMTIFHYRSKKFIDLNYPGLIPPYMANRPYVRVNDEIYAGFQVKEKEYVSHFDGEKWRRKY